MQGNALYNDCGGERVSFPQRTIYDAMREHNVSFGMFLNSTCGLDGKPCHGEHPISPDLPSNPNPNPNPDPNPNCRRSSRTAWCCATWSTPSSRVRAT